jgi:hypothetical protein
MLAEHYIPHTDVQRPPAFDIFDVLRLLAAYIAAFYKFKAWPLKRIVASYASRKFRRSTAPQPSEKAVRDQVRVYLYLRSLFFTSHDRCVLDSLVLLHFLSGYGIFPEWIMGAQTQPFLAHSWVQYGTLVLNDTPEKVCAFTPILIV